MDEPAIGGRAEGRRPVPGGPMPSCAGVAAARMAGRGRRAYPGGDRAGPRGVCPAGGPGRTGRGGGDRSYFFAAAAEAMRHILVDRARRRRTLERGGDAARVAVPEDALAAPDGPDRRPRSWPSMKPLIAWPRSTRRRPSWSSSANLAGFEHPRRRRPPGDRPRARPTASGAYARAWLRAAVGEPSLDRRSFAIGRASPPVDSRDRPSERARRRRTSSRSSPPSQSPAPGAEAARGLDVRAQGPSLAEGRRGS